jgi:hypothetical protein
MEDTILIERRLSDDLIRLFVEKLRRRELLHTTRSHWTRPDVTILKANSYPTNKREMSANCGKGNVVGVGHLSEANRPMHDGTILGGLESDRTDRAG